MKSETRRLNKLKDGSRNIAKTYELPLAALKIIEKAGRVHGQQSRAIQVAVELLWHNLAVLGSDATMQNILDSPVIGARPTSSRPAPWLSLRRSPMTTAHKVTSLRRLLTPCQDRTLAAMR